VPTVTLEGDTNGAPHPDPSTYAVRFKGKYAHHTIKDIGHNLPQEAPEALSMRSWKWLGGSSNNFKTDLTEIVASWYHTVYWYNIDIKCYLPLSKNNSRDKWKI